MATLNIIELDTFRKFQYTLPNILLWYVCVSFPQQRSQLGTTTVLMTNVCTLMSGAGLNSLDLESSFDGDDDDGT